MAFKFLSKQGTPECFWNVKYRAVWRVVSLQIHLYLGMMWKQLSSPSFCSHCHRPVYLLNTYCLSYDNWLPRLSTTPVSYHHYPPRKKPEVISSDCFQNAFALSENSQRFLWIHHIKPIVLSLVFEAFGQIFQLKITNLLGKCSQIRLFFPSLFVQIKTIFQTLPAALHFPLGFIDYLNQITLTSSN